MGSCAERVLRGTWREITARVLVDANRRGVDSHGVFLVRLYLPRLRSGSINGRARAEVVVNGPGYAVLDGHNGLGAYIGSIGMALCCRKARRTGCAAVAVRHSSHFGAAAYFAELATKYGCVGVAFSNSDPGLAPRGATAPLLGTNPLAISVGRPARHAPWTLDIATSSVAQSRVKLAAQAGRSIPLEWAVGPDGRPTADPVALSKARSFLWPGIKDLA